jgi:hypothetical protein
MKRTSQVSENHLDDLLHPSAVSSGLQQRGGKWRRLVSAMVISCCSLLALSACGDVQWFPADGTSTATAPTEFTFSEKTGVALNTVVQSDSVTLSGFSSALAVSVSGAESEYSINGGAFTSAAGTILPNQTLRVQHTSASTASTAVTTTVTVGTYSTTFTSITSSS